jgi:NADH-quinone oxidoreductase subunit N
VRPEEFYVLLLLAVVGSLVLVASNHFVSFFLGLEVLSIALYALVAYDRTTLTGVEAGLKYLVLAAASVAFLLFGMALVYAESGGLSFAEIARARPEHPVSPVVLGGGLALLMVGIGFKLALVPFHLWTPDVYQGAPAPVTAFIATASKGAMFVVLLRLFRQLRPETPGGVLWAFAALAVASMFAGNLLALLERNVKRMLAYSSIAHLGYLLVAFLAGGPLADTAAACYLAAYFLTMLGALGVVAVLSGADRDADAPADYQGLAWRRPWLAAVMCAMLLSLAGIPLTAGFVGKFYVVAAGAEAGRWWLVLALAVNSALGLFYYLRLLIVMFAPAAVAAPPGSPAGDLSSRWPRPAPWAGCTLAALTLLLVWLGVSPGTLIRLITGVVQK